MHETEMRAIVDALVSATNLAMMLRDESADSNHRKAADKLLSKLDRATTRVIELREEPHERL